MMNSFVEFFGEDSLSMIIVLVFITLVSLVFIVNEIKSLITKRKKQRIRKDFIKVMRADRRETLKSKAFDFAMTYCSIVDDVNICDDENTVIYKEVFV